VSTLHLGGTAMRLTITGHAAVTASDEATADVQISQARRGLGRQARHGARWRPTTTT